MKIIIPMTGYGSRFVVAGYKDLKPFIKVQGKPMIEWIVKGMYPNEKKFLFDRGLDIKPYSIFYVWKILSFSSFIF